jgi:uncharacterized tellurite resistance protein B-like protein
MTQRSIGAEIGLCLLFSAVDGEISDKELGALSNRLGHLLGDDFDVMRLPGLVESELGSLAEEGVDGYVGKLPARIPADRRYEAVRAACVVACADGLAPEEEEVVRQVSAVLEVDPEDIIVAVGSRRADDTIGPADDSHDDEPDDNTKLIADKLISTGWIDPMQALRDAGVGVSGFGALALQYESPNGHLLRVEHHTCDHSIHLHVTDAEDTGSDLVVFPDGRERDVLGLIEAMQDVVTLADLEPWIAKLLSVARVCIFQGETLVDIERPA